MQRPVITEESFVRDLPYNALAKLAEKLDANSLWERLASVIPTKPDNIFSASGENFEARYTMAQITNLSTSKSSTKALIEDWRIQNCKIKHLVEALYQAHLNAAAAYLQQEIMHAEPKRYIQQKIGSIKSNCEVDIENSENKVPEIATDPLSTHCENVPVIAINNSLPPLLCSSNGQLATRSLGTSHHDMENSVTYKSEEQKTSDQVTGAYPPTDCQCTENFDQLKEIPFCTLRIITNNFDQRNFKDGGNLIGQGGFGTVLIGIFSTGYKVAVKCLKDSSDDSLLQFKTEVETLAMFKHENLVQLLGYSIAEDGPCCLVYQYMSNGSLEERLACRYDTEPLSNNIRLNIIKGTAAGMAFLHKGGLVHRDIKSANILLDDTFKPKVGDFATARVLPSGMTSHIMKASVVIGTMAYLAPEALSFIIHPSLDSFSFGVVILEILTGLPVTDLSREDVDLKIHVQEHCCEGEEGEEPGTIYDLLDKQGGLWTKSIVEGLYSIACRCLEHARRRRPKMDDILSELQRLDKDCIIPESH